MPSTVRISSSAPFLAVLALGALAAAYLYGQSSSSAVSDQPGARRAAGPRTVIGNVIAIDPPMIRLEGFGADAGEVFDVIVSKETDYVRLDAWEPGEREAAQKSYEEMITRLNPVDGQPIPPPPQEMRLASWSSEEVRTGQPLGVLLRDSNGNEEGFAVVIRPLTEKEIEGGRASGDFPLP